MYVLVFGIVPVPVPVRVHDGPMRMQERRRLRQVQPDADGHQQGHQQERGGGVFTKEYDREHCAYERKETVEK